MSCTRAREIDLAAFRAEPGLAEFEDFARHYPTCPECAREVASWSALEAALRDAGGGGSGGHPSEERLLSFQDAPQTLDASLRQGIERHLAGCAQCRNELAVLRRFDLGALASPEPARAASAAASGGGLRAGLTRLAETLFGVPQPAWALALLLALALPAAWLSWRVVAGSSNADAPPIAQRQEPAPAPILEPVIEPPPAEPEPSPELPRVLIGQEEMPEPTAPEPESSEAPPLQVAVEPPPAPPVPAPIAPEPEPAPVPEPFRIAALLPSELPHYAPDAALVGSLDPIRVASVVRAAAGELPRIRALGPEHRGATRQASPTLYWSLDAKSDVPVELTLVAEDATEPLLELRVARPGAGIHALPLSERGVALEPGTPYLWYASLVPDDARRDQDVVSGAAIVRAPADAELARRLEGAPPERRAHLLAEAGYWYDAFATVAQWLAAEPDAPRLQAYRDALLRQAGLSD